MRNIENYINEAKKNETVFRLILDSFKNYGVKHQGLSIDEIYSKYSEGRRYGIWTILCFKEVEPNVFEFGCQDIAALSGWGSVDLYSLENGLVKKVKNVMYWRS